ncbi:MAG: hypothetical protein JWO32_381 [Bacteroidetes bacterium]|nr:hypothetical protein [Bacteroidota bacterium]
MKKFTLLFIFLSIRLIAQTVVPQWQWARNVSLTYTSQGAIDMCIDDSSNIFILGTNEGPAIAGTYSLTSVNLLRNIIPSAISFGQKI